VHLSTDYDVIVVGGGQAGLALGYFLSDQNRTDFTILDAAEEHAAAWRERWESLKLFTPTRYSSLPGRAFPGDPDHYPTRDEVVVYLTDYARRFDLPVQLGSRVRSLQRVNGAYEVKTEDRTYRADQVVVATEPFQRSRVPAIADRLDPAIVQLCRPVSTSSACPGSTQEDPRCSAGSRMTRHTWPRRSTGSESHRRPTRRSLNRPGRQPSDPPAC
jgi:putative flavoprotein involved in K+ transport